MRRITHGFFSLRSQTISSTFNIRPKLGGLINKLSVNEPVNGQTKRLMSTLSHIGSVMRPLDWMHSGKKISELMYDDTDGKCRVVTARRIVNADGFIGENIFKLDSRIDLSNTYTHLELPSSSSQTKNLSLLDHKSEANKVVPFICVIENFLTKAECEELVQDINTTIKGKRQEIEELENEIEDYNFHIPNWHLWKTMKIMVICMENHGTIFMPELITLSVMDLQTSLIVIIIIEKYTRICINPIYVDSSKYTMYIYLNDVHDGGATIFPDLGVKVEAIAGRMLWFLNLKDPNCKMDNVMGSYLPFIYNSDKRNPLMKKCNEVLSKKSPLKYMATAFSFS